MTSTDGDDVPDPADVATPADLAAALRALRMWAGQPSLRRLRHLGGVTTDLAGREIDALPVATTSYALRGARMPSAPFVRAFVRACLRARYGEAADPGRQVEWWHRAWLAAYGTVGARGQATDRGDGGPGRRPSTVPRQLPPAVAAFTGRTGPLAALDRLLDADPAGPVLAVVAGLAGVGKTALAVQWGHRTRDRFPDGQLYLDLRGTAAGPPLPPEEALGQLLRAFGTPPVQVPVEVTEATARFRSLVADLRILLVLDNVADPAQVRPLLPTGGGSVVLVTSRNRLPGLVARDGARLITLDPLPRTESVALLATVLGPHRVGPEAGALARLAERCGDLPLALRIAAAHLTGVEHLRIRDLADQLAGGGRVAALAVPGDERATVAGAFDLSYLRLPERAQRLLRLLGLLPGRDFTAELAAQVAGTTVAAAERTLATFLTAGLADRRDDRYLWHDLVRGYAADRAHREETPAARRAALARAYRHHLRGCHRATAALYPGSVRLPGQPVDADSPLDPGTARRWLDAERPNLIAYGASAGANGHPSAAWRLADLLRSYLVQRGYVPEGLSLARAALAAAEAAAEPAGQAAALLTLAALADAQGRYRDAYDAAGRARCRAAAAGWTAGEAVAHRALGVSCWQLGRPAEAIAHHRQARRHARAAGWRHADATAANSLAVVHLDRGELARAARLVAEALGACQRLGFTYGVAASHATLAETCRYRGDFAGALRNFAKARARFAEVGDSNGIANSLRGYAAILTDLQRRPHRALALAQWALATFRGTGNRRLEAEALATVGDAESASDPRAAVASYRHAAQLASDGGYRFLQARALVGLALAEHRQHTPEPAWRHAVQARAIAEAADFRLLQGRACTVLAECRLRAGRPGDAADLAGQALSLYRGTGCRLGEAQARLALGHAFGQLGDPGSATRHARSASRTLAELRGVAPPPRSRAG